MQWKAELSSSRVQSVEFFDIQIPLNRILSNKSRVQIYRGAVVFGPPRESGCEVLRVFAPVPEPRLLYEELAVFHSSTAKEKLVFQSWRRSEVMHAVQMYCVAGIPLPDVFAPNVAQFVGFSDFQMKTYAQTCQIPHGETRSYSWLASRARKLRAERAVGRAMKTNPFPLFIPCHRVIKKDGNIGGYIGSNNPNSWQLVVKKFLLELEGFHQQPTLFSLWNFTSENIATPTLALV